MGFWLLIALVLGLWGWHYHRKAVHKPTLVYQTNSFHQQLIAQLPRLSRAYHPTPWAYNTHLQLVWLVLRQQCQRHQPPMERELLTMADGGTTALDWLHAPNASPQSPTLVVLHTIGGSRHSMAGLMQDLQRHTGWRVVLCLRRGHDTLPFTAPHFNTLGHVPDLHEQLAHIHARYPHSPLYGIGSSAGSGLLVRYLGETGEKALLDAGVAYCPAYNTDVAFDRLHPFYDAKITRDLIAEFIAPHKEQFGHLPEFAHACQARTLAQLQQYMHALSGYDSPEHYAEHCNPAPVMHRIRVPLLVINADDDPVCVLQNVLEHEPLIQQMEHTLLVRTQRGSHCAFYEGWRARSWANALMAEYLQAVHHLTAQRIPPNEKCAASDAPPA